MRIKMKILSKLLIILLFTMNSFSYAGTRDPNTSDDKYVAYGNKYVHTVPISGKYVDGKAFSASAVIIDDHHVVTAAHIVNEAKNCFVIVNEKTFFLSKIVVHKNFNINRYGIADIALGFSDNSFKLNFYPELYSKRDELDKLCSISGYGFTGTFITGAKIHDGKKRAGSNFIDAVDKDLLICSPSKKGENRYTSLEFLIASGDSGGGLFINAKLAGINSCVIAIGKKPISSYGEQSGHTRISKYIDWIEEIRQENLLDLAE